MQRFLPVRPGTRLTIFLVLLSFATLLLTRPGKNADFQEYALMTIALSSHASPDIRLADVDIAHRLSPEPGFVTVHDQLRAGMQRGDHVPFSGFVRGKDGRYYAIHFFAYSALAVLPFKVIDAVGGRPFKAYQVVNLAALAILSVAMFRFTGSSRRAILGTVFFLACGGYLYANWASTEFFTACSLLAGLLFTVLGRPYLGALLAGVAAMQNPPLIFFSVFAPLIRACWLLADERLSFAAALRKTADRHTILASFLQAFLALVPVLFSMAVFGVPSPIAAMATDPALITPGRLLSFYFDLNQGLILGFPVVLALVAVQLAAKSHRRWLPHTLAAVMFSVALAVPSLATTNWNSAAEGMMRYAFWGGMPLLYLALTCLHRVPRWPIALLAAMFLVQAGAMKHARSYHYVQFSPVARFMLDTFPKAYAPEPEIFLERTVQVDGAGQPDSVVSYPGPARPVKTVFNTGSPAAHAKLCGPGGQVVLPAGGKDSPGGWRYIDGVPACAPGSPR